MPAYAAQVTVDSTATTTTLSQKMKPAMVFISSTTGYMFYKDSGGTCVYSKTTNGGTSWNAAVTVTAQTDCLTIRVWYDQWTPGDSGTMIHIVFNDRGNDDIWYDTLNTSGDVAGTEVAMSTTAGNTMATADTTTISKGTDGDLYIGFCDGSAANACNVMKCTGTCTSAGNWVQSGAGTPIDVANDPLQLMPLASGNMLLIRDDISADDIQSKVYTDSSNTWAGSWTNIDTSAVENATYPETIQATVDTSNNDVYLAYGSSVAGAGTADIRTAVYSGGSWSSKTDVVTNVNTMIALDIALDQRSKDVYVGYLQGTAGSNTTAYYKKSLNGMTSWGSAVQFNETTGDNRYVYLNKSSSDRIYGVFYNNATNDGLFGDTLAALSAVDPSWSTASADFKIYESSSLVWGAGTLACSGTLTDDNAATITCSGNGINNSTQYRVDVLLKNAGGTTIKMNGASDLVDHVAVKAGWAGTNPTLGSCGFSDTSSDNGSTSCDAVFSGNNVRITNTGAGNVNIQAGDTEGMMYLITTDSNVPTTNSTSYLTTTLDGVSEDSSKITIPKELIVSITVSDGAIAYGLVAVNASKDSTSGDLNDTQQVTNDGTATVTLNIRGQDTSCPWTLSGSSGADAYRHQFCSTGTGSPDACDATPTWNNLTTSNQTLTTGLSPAGTFRFDLRLTTPTSSSCFVQQSADVIIQAVAE